MMSSEPVPSPLAPTDAAPGSEEDQLRAEFLKERLMRILGRDLRDPVTSITFSAALLRTASLDPDQVRNLTRISRAADRLSFMLRDLLDYTSGRLGGGIPIVPRSIDGHDLVREVVREFERTHPMRDFLLETVGDGSGEWDAMRLSHLVSNLVDNAVRHGGSDSPIGLLAIGDGTLWTLEVHNQGPPIPAGLLPVITDPFRRALHPDGRKMPSKGLGLGLSIAEQIAVAHGGQLEARSSAEAGTTFTVRLPRRASARLDPAHSRSAVLEWLDRAWS